MKISRIEMFHVDAGWRVWSFVKIQTDDGIVGYGECSNPKAPRGVEGAMRDLEVLLLGRDPRPVETLYWEMYRQMRQSHGGISSIAIAGIDAALWDIKAKALGVPVYELFGGPTRHSVRLYWSHCGTSRARAADIIGVPPIRSMEDIRNLGQEVVNRGFTALKTNVVIPGDPASVYMPGFGANSGNTEQVVTRDLVRHIETLVGTFREAVGDGVDICLDLNFNFKAESCIRIAKAVEKFDLLWLEVDIYDPETLRQIRQAVDVPVCSGENLYTTYDYLPYLSAYAMDVVMIDVPWNGFSQAKKIADLSEAFQLNIAPHNYYSHLSTLMSAHLCACVPNVRIMEIDIDDVPWKDDMITEPLEIVDGFLKIPDRPGWGADLNESVLAEHAWRN
jgi:L-alanine-DL-glutamate epimerase-like enolase superfamily enzyme